MVKIVNGVVVQDDASDAGASASGSAGGSGASALTAAMKRTVVVCGRPMPLYGVLAGSMLLGLMLAGPRGMFYVTFAFALYMVWTRANRRGASSTGGGSVRTRMAMWRGSPAPNWLGRGWLCV